MIYQKLFDYLSDELGVTAMNDQLSDICSIVKEIQNNWISVKEQLPETTGKYLCIENNVIALCIFEIKDELGSNWITIGGNTYDVYLECDVYYEIFTNSVTYWMPLPQKPQ